MKYTAAALRRLDEPPAPARLAAASYDTRWRWRRRVQAADRGQLLCQTCNNALTTIAKKCPVFLRAKGGKRVGRCMEKAAAHAVKSGSSLSRMRTKVLCGLRARQDFRVPSPGRRQAQMEGRSVRRAPKVALGMKAAERQAPVRRRRPGEHPRPGRGERAAHQEALGPDRCCKFKVSYRRKTSEKRGEGARRRWLFRN